MKICVVGSTNIDINVHVKNFPLKGQTILGTGLAYKYGGKGANQACACAKLGADVTFLTCVGDDDNGHKVIADLGKLGADVSKVKFSKTNPTGTAIINLDENGDNNIVVVQGANLDCDVEYVMANEDVIKEADFVLLQLEIPFDAVEKTIELAHKHGTKVVLNPAPVAKLNENVYSMIDFITPNETEAAYITEKEATNVDSVAESLKAMGVKNVLVTLGSEGSVLYTECGKKIEVPARKVKAIDTVAAGDCYNGAFVTALANGEDYEGAMNFATCASALAVQKEGAQDSIPTLEELKAFMN